MKHHVGWVACDYMRGDRLTEVRHGPVRATETAALNDKQRGHYQGVRYVASDGYFYVEKPSANPSKRSVRKRVAGRKVKGGRSVTLHNMASVTVIKRQNGTVSIRGVKKS